MKLTQNETFKKITNKKIVLGVLAIILAIAFIAVTSFIPFVITKEKLTSEKFWTGELIIIAITIFAMMATLFVGQASNAQNANSEIAKAKVSFMASVDTITSICAFCQWIKRVLQPRDIQSIKERELRHIGIDDYTVLALEDAQIVEMAKAAQKYNGRYYSQITQKQADFILSLKDGVRHIDLVEPEYYLTVSSIDSNKTISEKSGREQLVKTVKLVFSVVSKIILTLIPAVIFAALAVDLTEGSGDAAAKAEAWATFFARMFALVSSAFYGYVIGCKMNDIDADYINLKSGVHKQYLEDKEFKPIDQQELARNEYIERVKKDNAEYTKQLELKEVK